MATQADALRIELEKLSSRRDSVVDLCLGILAESRGDTETAIRHYSAAAAEGIAIAQYLLGLRLTSFRHDALKLNEAKSWLERASNGGIAQAGTALAAMYMLGFGGEDRESEAVHWLLTARRHGDAEAHAYLGQVYRTANKPNADISETLFREGVKERDPLAMAMLGQMLIERSEPSEQAEGVCLLHDAAEANSWLACLLLRDLYSNGRAGCPIDHKKAEHYILRVAEIIGAENG